MLMQHGSPLVFASLITRRFSPQPSRSVRSELAVNQIGVRDELAYQKNQRTRELLRDLENSIINGVTPTSNPIGSSSVRRTMRGLISSIATQPLFPWVMV